MRINLLGVEEIHDYNSLDYVYEISLFGHPVGRIKMDEGLYSYHLEGVFLERLAASALKETAKLLGGEIID